MAPRRTSPSRAVARLVQLPAGVHAPPRAHVALPSGRVLLTAGALALACAALYAGARTTSVFAVESVQVRGASPALAAALREALAPVVGTSLLVLDRDDVVGRARRIPEVAAVDYDRAFPSTLVVLVREERPAAVARRGAEAWVVAASGRVLHRAERGSRPALPRVWVPKRTRVAPGERLGDDAAAAAVTAVSRISTSFPGRVDDVRAGAGELTFSLASGIELRLGDPTDVELKLAVAARILPSLTRDTGAAESYLDVSVVARPVAGGTLDSEVEVED